MSVKGWLILRNVTKSHRLSCTTYDYCILLLALLLLIKVSVCTFQTMDYLGLATSYLGLYTSSVYIADYTFVSILCMHIAP